MPLLEEVGEGSEGANGGAEDLKAEHRRKRAKKANAKSRNKKVEGESVSYSVFGVLALAAVVVGVGLWSRAAALLRESNKCKMTMSRPEYVHLPVEGYPIVGGEAAGEIHGYGYRLMRYMDRKLPASERRDPRKPGGIPVLFVPGHLGSYEQARSLGSRASEAKIATPRRRLDIFTLDLLGEWTALHGSLVWRQAEFLNHAVEAILALYEGGDDPPSVTSVMIVGHSLGGLVARAAFTLPSYRVGSITDMVTLGTPHDKAPWMMDYSVVGLYHCTDSLWRWHSPHPSTSAFSHCWPPAKPTMETAQPPHPHPTLTDGDGDSAELGVPNQEASPLGHLDMRKGACVAGDGGLDSSSEDCAVDDEALQAEASIAPVVGWGQVPGVDGETLLGNTVLLSLSGGPKDMMVHPSLCEVEGLGLEGQSLGFTTAAVDGCGFGVDHLALVWCKQLVGRVVDTLSELEKLHAAGAGTGERTRVAAGILSSSQRSPKTNASSGASGNYGSQQLPQSAGFQEAADAGAEWILVARSLVTDRSYLLIPAWVCLAGLALAAALTKGLSSKTAKERALPPVLHLLTPETQFQWQAVKFSLSSLWASARSQGKPGIVAVAASCAVVTAWTFGGDVAGYFPGATGRVQDAVESVPGISAVLMVGTTVLRVVGGMVGGVAQALNPFEGAVDAFRLPNKAIAAVYFVSTGWMLLFLFFVSVLGAVGNGACWLLGLKPSRLAACGRALRSRSVVVVAGCAAVLCAHVEKFSLPPTFRAITVTGEVSMVFMALSLSLYLLLVSLALFPASVPATLAHQRLVLLLYAPAPAVLMGPQLAAAGVILGRAGPHEPFVSVGELVVASLSLLPIIASVWFARRARPFPSPPSIRGFLAELRAQMDEEAARANGGSIGRGVNGRHGAGGSSASDLAAAALKNPHGHGACGKCLHADGGRGAVFVETDQELVSVGAGVTLGPGFRVVACDCPQRERAAPSTWCEFCRCICDVCGGCKDAARATRGARMPRGASSARGEETKLSEELGAGGAVGVLSVAVLYVGLWAFGMRVMGTPCHSLLALAVMGGVLCGMRWGVAKDAAKGFRAS